MTKKLTIWTPERAAGLTRELKERRILSRGQARRTFDKGATAEDLLGIGEVYGGLLREALQYNRDEWSAKFPNLPWELGDDGSDDSDTEGDLADGSLTLPPPAVIDELPPIVSPSGKVYKRTDSGGGDAYDPVRKDDGHEPDATIAEQHDDADLNPALRPEYRPPSTDEEDVPLPPLRELTATPKPQQVEYDPNAATSANPPGTGRRVIDAAKEVLRLHGVVQPDNEEAIAAELKLLRLTVNQKSHDAAMTIAQAEIDDEAAAAAEAAKAADDPV